MIRSERVNLLPLFAVALFGLLQTGCAVTGSLSKAPVPTIFMAGNEIERKQEFSLRRLKWEHGSKDGEITGAQYFRDRKLPIPGVRGRDTLYINSGPYRGAYTVARVVRLRVGNRPQVFVKIRGTFPVAWKSIHRGNGGMAAPNNVFTDDSSFPPEVPKGTQILIGTQTYTIEENTVVKTDTMRQQRIGYKIAEKLPADLRGASYELRIPEPNLAANLDYQISWLGSSLTGRYFTIGINRRRYGEKEMEDLLNSDPESKKAISSAPAKQATALVFQILGSLAIGVGGYLFLVNRDDFRKQEYIPLSIAGGGLVFFAAAIPLIVSQHNDYLEGARIYNKNLVDKLKLDPNQVADARSLPQPRPTPAPIASTAPHTLLGKQ